MLEKQDINDNMQEVIATCISIKAKFVEQDEFDHGERQKLNFGHTLGHAIEKMTNFKIPHGQAVGIGMKLICQWAEEKDLTQKGCAQKIEKLINKFDMANDANCDISCLWSAVSNDKKLKGKNINLVLIKDIGDSYLYLTQIDKLY